VSRLWVTYSEKTETSSSLRNISSTLYHFYSGPGLEFSSSIKNLENSIDQEVLLLEGTICDRPRFVLFKRNRMREAEKEKVETWMGSEKIPARTFIMT
jgi:hypothetical protein